LGRVQDASLASLVFLLKKVLSKHFNNSGTIPFFLALLGKVAHLGGVNSKTDWFSGQASSFNRDFHMWFP